MISLGLKAEDLSRQSDAALVRMALENQDDFVFLVERYRGRLASYVRRLTNVNSEEAEDILQEVFIKVYLNLNAFDEHLKFSSWIYRITHNQVISSHRKLKARPEGYVVDLDDQAAKNLAAEIDLKVQIDAKIMQAAVGLVLRQLEDKYREVLILKFLEEKSYQEISDILKKPLGTVASLLNKAKAEFKKALLQSNIKWQ
jgi:RNA polymerase sigma-70 factor (ECF subfamily)